jgi:hypothetical protein
VANTPVVCGGSVVAAGDDGGYSGTDEGAVPNSQIGAGAVGRNMSNILKLMDRIEFPDSHIIRIERDNSGLTITIQTVEDTLRIRAEDMNWMFDCNFYPVTSLDLLTPDSPRIPSAIQSIALYKGGSWEVHPKMVLVIWNDDELAMAIGLQSNPTYDYRDPLPLSLM